MLKNASRRYIRIEKIRFTFEQEKGAANYEKIRRTHQKLKAGNQSYLTYSLNLEETVKIKIRKKSRK